MKSALKPYFGPLTLEAIHKGMEAARRNADRLLEDAKILMEANRYPSACALAILSIEESGKLSILKNFAIERSPEQTKRLWREYRSHRNKNKAWILPDLVRNGAPQTMLGVKEAANPDGDHTAILDGLKQVAFYSDCQGKCHWSEPVDVVDEAAASGVIFIAGAMSVKVPTLRELELWQQHVEPFFAKPGMMNAVLAFQRAMFEEGLSDTRPESLEAFMKGLPVEIKGLKSNESLDASLDTKS